MRIRTWTSTLGGWPHSTIAILWNELIVLNDLGDNYLISVVTCFGDLPVSM